MSLKGTEIDERISSQLSTLYEQEKGCRWNGRVVQGVGSGLLFGGSAVVRFLYPPSTTSATLALRALSILPSWGIGAGGAGLLGALLPHRAMDEVATHAVSLGLLSYMPVTELYLNAERSLDKEIEFEYLQVLAGFVVTAILIKLIRHSRFSTLTARQAGGYEELASPLLKDKHYRVIGEGTHLWTLAHSISYVAVGALLIVAAHFSSEDHPLQTVLLGFGVYYIAQALTRPAWRALQERALQAESDYIAAREAEPLQGMPRAVRAWRLAQRALTLGVPLATSTLVAFPSGGTLGVAGALQGIEAEINLNAFVGPAIPQVAGIGRRPLFESRVARVVHNVYASAKFLGFTAYLAWFGYQVFREGNSVYNMTIGSFLSAFAVGFVSTTFADRRFTHETRSRALTTLFYRFVRDPRIGGIDPVYFYAAIVNAGVGMGNHSLQDLTVADFTAVMTAWVAYGFRLGQDMARFDTQRAEPLPVRNSNWLMYVFIIDTLERLRGEVV